MSFTPDPSKRSARPAARPASAAPGAEGPQGPAAAGAGQPGAQNAADKPLAWLIGTDPALCSNPELAGRFAKFKITLPAELKGPVVLAHCPECLHMRKKKEAPSLEVDLRDNSWVCHHCGFHGSIEKGPARRRGPFEWSSETPRKPRYDPLALPPRVLSWFQSRGISQETLEARKVGYGRVYMPVAESIANVVQFPYYFDGELVNVKHRDNEKRWRDEVGAKRVFYGLEDFAVDCTILVQGEIDKLTMDQVGVKHAMGAPYAASAKSANYEDHFEYLLNAEELLATGQKFILAFSNTDDGRRLEEEIARRLGKERCWRAQWPNDMRDANDTLARLGPEAVRDAIANARAYPVKGIFEAMDVADKIDALYEFGMPPGAPTGWATLNEHYTVKEGQWTLVTGIPGHGKSNFLDALLVNLAQQSNWRFGMFSPENQPIERHFANLMEKLVDKPFNIGPGDRITREEKDQSKLWLQEHFFVILPDEEEGNWSVDGILDLAKILVFRKGIKGLVIDPWNELDHSRTNGMTETEHISQALTKIRQFARAYGVHVWVVAHPAKLRKEENGKYPVPTPYDVAGCHSADTEVLTRRGWVPHPQVTLADEVASLCPITGRVVYDRPSHVHAVHYTGLLREFRGESFNAKVTPSHRMMVKANWALSRSKALRQGPGGWSELPARDFASGLRVPVAAQSRPEPLAADDFAAVRERAHVWRQAGLESLPADLWEAALSEKAAWISALAEAEESPDAGARSRIARFASLALAGEAQRLAIECGIPSVVRCDAGGAALVIQEEASCAPSVGLNRHVRDVPHSGLVYCLTMPMDNYITRRKGKSVVLLNSAHFNNKADNAISVWRNRGGKDEDVSDIHIQKVRFKEVGKVGVVYLRYNRFSGRFIDDIDQDIRTTLKEEDIEKPSEEQRIAPSRRR
jgi:twinkle protein